MTSILVVPSFGTSVFGSFLRRGCFVRKELLPERGNLHPRLHGALVYLSLRIQGYVETRIHVKYKYLSFDLPMMNITHFT